MDTQAQNISASPRRVVATDVRSDNDGVGGAVARIVRQRRLINRLEARAKEADTLVWGGGCVYSHRNADLRDMLLEAAWELKARL